jgi:aspartate kinase
MERAVVHGVRVVRAGARFTLTGVADHTGAAARIFRLVAVFGVEPSHVVRGPAHADLSFTLPSITAAPVAEALLAARDRVGFEQLVLDESVAELILTGEGLRSDPVVVATFCEALARCGVSLTAVSLETSRLSLLCPENQLDEAVRALSEAFEISYSACTATKRSSEV